jgi:hypothetical protein
LKPPIREFAGVHIFSLRLRAGDDASCLNLYQPLQPRLLGVPEAMTKNRPFRFSAGLWKTPQEEGNPWLLLDKKEDDGSIPVFADATAAQYTLHLGLGDTLETTADDGTKVKLKIVALLQDSIFQSELLMAERKFLELFPRHEGFSFFLINRAWGDRAAIQSTLTKALAEYGFEMTRPADRVKSFLEVENMYLATFQALGQLGLALGALGLAIVLLRGVWERRGELALLQALGFRKGSLAWLVLIENGFLLFAGLGIGALAALVAVLPHVSATDSDIVWQRLGVSLGLVVAVGLGAALAAIVSTLRAPILTALRRE